MADTGPDRSHPPLGAAQLVSDTFAQLFRHFGLFMAITLLPSVGLSAIQLLIVPNALDPSFDPDLAEARLVGGAALTAGITILIGLLVMGTVTLAAYDTRLGLPIRVGAHIGRTLAAAPAIVILGLLLYLAVGFASLLLLVPGLYLAARYWVLVPVILVERAGFSGLSRAGALSRHYRWPILGALVLLFVLVALIGLALTVLFAAILGTGIGAIPGLPDGAAIVAFDAISSALQYALVSIFTALLYARLRELKEGLGVEDLVSVFE